MFCATMGLDEALVGKERREEFVDGILSVSPKNPILVKPINPRMDDSPPVRRSNRRWTQNRLSAHILERHKKHANPKLYVHRDPRQ